MKIFTIGFAGKSAHTFFTKLKDANVKKLVLSHFGQGEVDEVATEEAISKKFKGEVVFGHDLMEVSP